MAESKKEVKRQILQLHIVGVDVKNIVSTFNVSERTVYRYIKEFEDGKSDIDLANTVKTVKKFRDQELEDMLELLSSKMYLGKIAMALDKIDDKQIDKELKERGIRGVTGFIGTLMDKRLRSYAHELERENIKLRKDIANNSRKVIFMNEGELYASSDELPERHSKDIS